MNETSEIDTPVHIRFDTEELSRLLSMVCTTLGVPGVWDKDLIQRLTTLRRGFTALSEHHQSARKWEAAIQELLDNPVAPDSIEQNELNVLGLLMKQQPTAMPLIQTRACLSLASRVFAATIKNISFSATFLENLIQLFSSNGKSWNNTRILLANAGKNGANTDGTDLTDVCRKFIRSANILLCEEIHFPDLRPVNCPPAHPYMDSIETMDSDKKTESAHTQKSMGREVTVFDTKPNLHLFQFQIVQQEQEPTLNAYRLENDWNSLTNEEYMECSQILIAQLRSEADTNNSNATQIHAACRILSQLAQISIEKLASLPIIRKGTMHLDLQCGLIRRDIMVIAPRIDRSKGHRWKGRWLRTPVPPEIISVLSKAAKRDSAARTIGDLMVGVGLTPTSCHQLMNSGRKEPRIFESLRLAKSLRNFLLTRGIHPSTVSRVLGDITILPRAHQYYLALDQKKIHKAINLWCDEIGLCRVADPKKVSKIGSPKVLSFSEMQQAHRIIQQENHQHRMSINTRSPLHEVIEFHNNYICRYALQLNWALGTRVQNLSKMTASMLLGDPDHVVISDRESDRYSEMRVCPLSNILRRSRFNLIEHLKAMGKRIKANSQEEAGIELAKYADGTNPEAFAFPLIYIGASGAVKIRSATRKDLEKYLENTKVNDLNEPRHFMVTNLDLREVASIGIDALIGHHQGGAPPFGVGSGMSIADFSSYMTPVLEQLHNDLQISELIGLGRQDASRHKLPDLAIPDTLHIPRNTFLNQRLDIEDFNPPDIVLAEEDCPITTWTMPALNKMRRLRADYLASNSVAAQPWGAVCFCLIAFDLVITPSDVNYFLEQLIAGKEKYVGKLCGVEVHDQSGRPIEQCLMSRWTRDALKIARRQSKPPSLQECINQLKSLLRLLDKSWPHQDQSSSLSRLQSLSCHAAMYELPPTARFGFFHKAPFIPLQDLQRITFGIESTFQTSLTPSGISKPRIKGFQEQLNIVKKWAEHDKQLGEYKRRANGLIKELEIWSQSTEFDEADHWFLSLILAELSANPPFRRISLPVLHKYLLIATPFFDQVRRLGDVPRTSAAWDEFLPIFQNENDISAGAPRWVGLHIGAWLRREGVPVPRILQTKKATRENYRPHLSVYITPKEVNQTIAFLCNHEINPPWDSWMPTYLKIARFCPLRPAEIRFLKARDISSEGKHIHIQTSGHIHLKTATSKGLVSIPMELQEEMLMHQKRRRESSMGLRACMFALSNTSAYSDLDHSIGLARSGFKQVTGRSDFRMYDLRACAITDLIFDIPKSVSDLTNNLTIPSSIFDANSLNDRFIRCARAAREARQVSCLTTLRYYNLSGKIEARCEINKLNQHLRPSAKYQAAIEGKNADSIHSRNYRASCGATTRLNPKTTNDDAYPLRLDHQHPLIQPVNCADHLADHRLIFARLLRLGGLNPLSAADESGINASQLQPIDSVFNSNLKRAGIHSLPKSLISGHLGWHHMLDGLSRWAFIHQAVLAKCVSSRPRDFRAYGSKINFRDHHSIISTVHIWTGLRSIGVQPVIFFGTDASPSERVSVRMHMKSIGGDTATQLLTRQKFAAMRFRLIDPGKSLATPSTNSNHQMGKIGRLVVSAICLSVDTSENNFQ